MKKTYVTSLPDHIGTFLKASRCFADLGMNITRCSYNKAVDINTLFIEAEGTQEQHEKALCELRSIGYIQAQHDKSVVLLEFMLRDEPGVLVSILEIISEFNFNISYISSQENGTEFQPFKIGLFVDEKEKFEEFLIRASALCKVRVIDYNHSEKVYDNSIFYNSFVSELTRNMDFTEEARRALLVNANLAMQILDEKGMSPYKTFDNISKLAGILSENRGNNFSPRITDHRITDNTTITIIEPPCGSNTIFIHSGNEYLFVDSGYALYKQEMMKILNELIPDFKNIRKRIFLTHADLDHCGLLNMFDEVLVSERTRDCLKSEYEGMEGFRGKNQFHKPYIAICKLLTAHEKIDPFRVNPLWKSPEKIVRPIVQTGFLQFGDLNFEVYEGSGGHLPGETMLIDYDNRIAFTGDIFVNLKNMIPVQAKYNKYAPILMTSVDTRADLCKAERAALFDRLGSGNWQIFSSHGAKYDYNVKIENTET